MLNYQGVLHIPGTFPGTSKCLVAPGARLTAGPLPGLPGQRNATRGASGGKSPWFFWRCAGLLQPIACTDNSNNNNSILSTYIYSNNSNHLLLPISTLQTYLECWAQPWCWSSLFRVGTRRRKDFWLEGLKRDFGWMSRWTLILCIHCVCLNTTNF